MSHLTERVFELTKRQRAILRRSLSSFSHFPSSGAVFAALWTNARSAELWLTGAVALTDLAILAGGYPPVIDSQVIRYTVEWVPNLGLEFSLRMDGFAWVFAILVAGIGGAVRALLHVALRSSPRFFSFLLAFMGAMFGIVLYNLIQSVFLWAKVIPT